MPSANHKSATVRRTKASHPDLVMDSLPIGGKARGGRGEGRGARNDGKSSRSNETKTGALRGSAQSLLLECVGTPTADTPVTGKADNAGEESFCTTPVVVECPDVKVLYDNEEDMTKSWPELPSPSKPESILAQAAADEDEDEEELLDDGVDWVFVAEDDDMEGGDDSEKFVFCEGEDEFEHFIAIESNDEENIPPSNSTNATITAQSSSSYAQVARCYSSAVLGFKAPSAPHPALPCRGTGVFLAGQQGFAASSSLALGGLVDTITEKASSFQQEEMGEAVDVYAAAKGKGERSRRGEKRGTWRGDRRGHHCVTLADMFSPELLQSQAERPSPHNPALKGMCEAIASGVVGGCTKVRSKREVDAAVKGEARRILDRFNTSKGLPRAGVACA